MFVDSTGNGTSLHISPVLVFGSITFSIFSFFCLVAFNCELFKYLRVFWDLTGDCSSSLDKSVSEKLVGSKLESDSSPSSFSVMYSFSFS